LELTRQSQLQEGKQRIIIGLININAIIIMLGGVGGYFLARRTILPIKRAHDAQSAFAADASHELRTPLATMRAEIEVALREKKFSLEDARVLLKSNLEELEKLTSLSDGLLRLARTDLATELSFETVSLSSLVGEALERFTPLAREKNIEITTSLPGKMDTNGDAPSLIELFATLIDNALKYSKTNQSVNITGKNDGKYWEVAVKDYGLGIKASELAHVFDRFYRGESSRVTGKISGYGLGLAIAKNIASLHKGEVRAQSTPGKGSVFIVRLPKG